MVFGGGVGGRFDGGVQGALAERGCGGESVDLKIQVFFLGENLPKGVVVRKREVR
jgi:hypothetical protein